MQAAVDFVDAEMARDIPRKIWTREEARALVDAGIPNAEKWELIEGDLIDRMGKKRPQVLWQHLTLAWLQHVFGTEFVQAESPSDVADEDNRTSEPEPDLMVTARSYREYSENPPPQDIRLVVEVSDSTLRFDLNAKMRLYARAGIVEYWVINIPDKQLVVHRNPNDGVYASITAYAFDAEVKPLVAPEAVFCLSRL